MPRTDPLLPAPRDSVCAVILQSIADGVFTVDEDFRITAFNRAAEEITGVARDKAIGCRCRDVFHASICRTGCALKHTLDTGLPVVGQPIYITSAAGRQIPVSISTAILRDSEGRPIGGVETFRDMTAIETLRKELRDKYTCCDIIGRSAPMSKLFDVMPQIAGSSSTVLIQGASGTGKELFARAIHDLSPRADGPFVAINCGALPDALLESELFGYKAGAFTDARQDKLGRLALADGGTIFLDEIGDVSPAVQSKLLRALQTHAFEPLGGLAQVKVDVRVIAATNKDLGALVENGAFREDFYYRINVLRLELPALRDRREDVPLLVDHFLAKLNQLQGKYVAGMADETMAVLLEHDFPGNVRELENAMEHAFVLCQGEQIQPWHLPASLRPSEPPATGSWSGRSLEEIERQSIAEAIRRNGGNRHAAARELGIHPSTLFRKIRRLGIGLPSGDGRRRT